MSRVQRGIDAGRRRFEEELERLRGAVQRGIGVLPRRGRWVVALAAAAVGLAIAGFFVGRAVRRRGRRL